MQIKELQTILHEHQFMADIDPKHVEKIAEHSSLKIFKMGDYLSRRGDPADCFYLIRNGVVAIEVFHPAKGPLTVETLDAGNVLGWAWLVPPYKWSFDARAMELTRGICIHADWLRKYCEQDHDVGYLIVKRFMLVMAERLEATRIQLLDLYGPDRH